MVSRKKRGWWRAWYSVALIVTGIVAVWYLLGVWHFTKFSTPDDASKFGESFGFVNSLISGLALAGVVIAISLQMRELALQRAELKLTRRELKKGAEAQQNLVHLNSLSTLLQSYFEEWRTNTYDQHGDFKRLLVTNPKDAEKHIVYKIHVCRALLEQMYLRAAGKPIGAVEDTSIIAVRRAEWMDRLELAVYAFGNQWEGIAQTLGVAGNGDTAANYVKQFKGSLDRLMEWVDALHDVEERDACTKVHGRIHPVLVGLAAGLKPEIAVTEVQSAEGFAVLQEVRELAGKLRSRSPTDAIRQMAFPF